MEAERCTFVIPHSCVIARNHLKFVITRRKVCISCLAKRAGRTPVSVVALQFVAETNLAGRSKAQRRKSNMNAAYPSRQRNAARTYELALICCDFFDMNRRWQGILNQIAGIQNTQPYAGGE